MYRETCNFHFSCRRWPWRWRQPVPWKHQYLSNSWHGVSSIAYYLPK